MVHTRAKKRQAEGQTDGAVEIQRFRGNVPLVVVKRDHSVEMTLLRQVKNGVGRDRSGDVEAPGPQILHGRCDFLDFLAAEHAPLAAVRIQRRHCNSGFRETESGKLLAGLRCELHQGLAPDLIRDFAKRQVTCEEKHPQGVRHEKSEHGGGVRELLQRFGVVQVRHIRQAQALLVDRCRRQSRRLALQAKLHSSPDRLEGRTPTFSGDFADGGTLPPSANVQHRHHPTRSSEFVDRDGPEIALDSDQFRRALHHGQIAHDHRLTRLPHLVFRHCFDHDLGSHPGGISDRHRDHGFPLVSHPRSFSGRVLGSCWDRCTS